MANDIPKLRTPGVIADELGVPLARVLYVLRTRNHIKPIGRAGVLRLYGREAVAMWRKMNSPTKPMQRSGNCWSMLTTRQKSRLTSTESQRGRWRSANGRSKSAASLDCTPLVWRGASDLKSGLEVRK